MDPCPVSKHGRHELTAVLPDDDTHDMTLFCDACGAMRRVPVSGSLTGGSLDDLDPALIAASIGRDC